MELLISKNMYEIPIPLMITNDSPYFNNENFVIGYHVYIKAWSLLLGECLFAKKEPNWQRCSHCDMPKQLR